MKKGKAYGFFDCRASKEEIEAEIPFIKDFTQTPSELEISLTEGIEELREDLELIKAYERAKSMIRFPNSVSMPDRFRKAKEIEGSELRYVIQATLPNKTNKRTANELSGILNQAYQSPLYEKGDHFRGGVFYEENGGYISRG